jgi:hypothetical protein
MGRLSQNTTFLWVLGVLCCYLALARLPALAQEETPAVAEFAPAVSFLPASTQGFLEFENLPALTERWQQTSLADLQHDPAMQEFIETQRDLIAEKLMELGVRAGVNWSDLRAAISGEVVLAWMLFEAPTRPFSVALLADTRGRTSEREALLEKIDASLRNRGAKVSRSTIRGESATIYNLPQKKGQLGVERLGVVTVAERVIISDRVETLAGMISAALDGRADGLVSLAAYQQVFGHPSMTGSENDLAGNALPRVRWFARPIEMGKILRELANVDRGNQVDILNLLSDQGFDVLQSAGGSVYVATEFYDLLHRGFLFAPPTVPGPERYEKAARVLQFPNVEMADIPAWVLPTAASYLQVNWKTEEAFWAIETLIDAAFDSEVFRPTLEGLKVDENLDIPGDIISNLNDGLIIITDNVIKDDLQRERVAGAFPLSDATTVATVVNRTMENDPDIFQLDYPHHVIWEVRPSEAEDIDFDVEDFGFGFDDEPAVANNKKSEPLMERWGITVFDGYLMFASHAEMLVDLVEHKRSGQGSFADQPAFERVRTAILREGGEERAMERIVRTDMAWRIKYELVRKRKFLESDSLLASLIRRLVERAEQAETEIPAAQPPKIDTSKLPPFQDIQQHVQPGGGFMKTTDSGWIINQFLLRKPAAD